MTTKSDVECLLREATVDDLPYVLSSWLKSASDDTGGIAAAFTRRVFYAEHERLLRESVIPRSRVLVAASDESPEVIRGWLCYEPSEHGTMLHYAYVRFDWRGLGVAKQLVDSIGPIALQTHCTRRGSSPYPYNPYPLFLGALWQPSPKLFSTTMSSTRSHEPSAETGSLSSRPVPTSTLT